MSDLNDLIHTNAVVAFQQGEKRECERIIKLLEKTIEGEKKLLDFSPNRTDFKNRFTKISIGSQFIELIKGEQK